MEILLIIVGLSYIIYSLFAYMGDGVKPLGDLSDMHHKWLFALWVGLWAVPYLFIGIEHNSMLMIFYASLFLSMVAHPFLKTNNGLVLHTGGVGGIFLALISLWLDFNLWMGLPLLASIYLITVLKGIKTASFYNAHIAFLIIYISLWAI